MAFRAATYTGSQNFFDHGCRSGTHTLGAAIGTGTGADPAILAALMAASDHLPVVAEYRVVPEPTVGVLLLIGSLGLLRRRLLSRARHEVLNKSQPPRQD